jgi:hypothetical protein
MAQSTPKAAAGDGDLHASIINTIPWVESTRGKDDTACSHAHTRTSVLPNFYHRGAAITELPVAVPLPVTTVALQGTGIDGGSVCLRAAAERKQGK